ncbi:hypothetical protein V2U75_28425, partial [Klebsiella pneumoniae]|nr:hypothetical protein [Klebsiella pneumoniae]
AFKTWLPITRTVRNAGQPCRPVARLCITLPSDRRVQKNLTTTVEGELIHEFFINGEYRNTIRMCLFQHQYLAEHKTPGPSLLKPTAQ